MREKGTILYRGAKAARTRQEILALAADLASAEGLEGLTIGRLAAELRMSKTGIFAHFGSKEELQVATVNRAKEVFLEQVVKPALAKPRGLKRLQAMLTSWLKYVEHAVFRGGCFFAAASLEFDSRPGRVRDGVAALTKAWMDALRNEIAHAKAQKEIAPGTQTQHNSRLNCMPMCKKRTGPTNSMATDQRSRERAERSPTGSAPDRGSSKGKFEPKGSES